jgi:two-component system sensor histidine kinase KdpD
MKVDKQWHPVDDVVGSALRRAHRCLEGHVVETSIPADSGLVPMDGLLIEQVLVNLLDNAAKYTPAGSVITVSAARTPAGAELAVSDRGPGLHEIERERIFDKFYHSAVTSSDRGRGAGLGLAICKAIVQAHGGAIRAEPREGGGSKFVFTLPVHGRPPMVEEVPAAERPSDG